MVQDTDWRKVRDGIVDSMTNFGQPVLTVEDGDYKHRGEMYLKHAFDGKALDPDYTERVPAEHPNPLGSPGTSRNCGRRQPHSLFLR